MIPHRNQKYTLVLEANNMKLFLQKGRRKWIIGCSFAIMMFCLLIGSIPAYNWGYHFILRQFPEKFTKPLEPQLVTELCQTLELSGSDTRCQRRIAYAFEFFPDFLGRYKRFTPRNQVDEEIGRYLSNCDNWVVTASDGTFQQCVYDFRGDGVFTLDINYRKGSSDPKNTLSVVWDTCSYTIHNYRLGVIFQCNPPLRR